jgi:hypothetical protein
MTELSTETDIDFAKFRQNLDSLDAALTATIAEHADRFSDQRPIVRLCFMTVACLALARATAGMIRAGLGEEAMAGFRVQLMEAVAGRPN